VNFHIAKRVLVFDLKKSWEIAGKWNARMQNSELESTQNSQCAFWRCFLAEIRTHFKENLEV